MRYFLSIVIFSILFSGCTTQSPENPNEKAQANLPPDIVSTIPEKDLTIGQTIYVPVYSHIYFGNHKNTINLTATLSIRNTDPAKSIVITTVEYYDSAGKLVRNYLNQHLQLAPMASKDYVVEENDTAGGVGANFIVKWGSQEAVTDPVVEAVMITTHSTQGISFVSTGRVTEQRPAAKKENLP